MQRRKFSREFKVEAVKLIKDRGVSVAQAGRDLGVHENVLRKWVKEFGSDPVQAFPGHGQMKGAVAELVGIEVGVVSGVINLELSGVEASDWRLRHEATYHET